MGEIRGEKVVFRKQDIVPLHELPSAQAHEPMVLHEAQASRTGIACRIVAATVALVLFLGAVLVGLVETGLFDSTLNARAVTALNQALGPRYRASVDHTVLRLAGFNGFALKAENVRIIDLESDKELATTVDREFTKLTQSGQLRKMYKKWFQSTLPQRSYNLNVVPNQLTSEVLIRPSNYVADWTVF